MAVDSWVFGRSISCHGRCSTELLSPNCHSASIAWSISDRSVSCTAHWTASRRSAKSRRSCRPTFRCLASAPANGTNLRFGMLSCGISTRTVGVPSVPRSKLDECDRRAPSAGANAVYVRSARGARAAVHHPSDPLCRRARRIAIPACPVLQRQRLQHLQSELHVCRVEELPRGYRKRDLPADSGQHAHLHDK